MTITQLLVWSQTIPVLIANGIIAPAQVPALLKSLHSSVSDPEIAAVSALIIAAKDSSTSTAGARVP